MSRADYKRARIVEAIRASGTDADIARKLDCSREYVRMVRADMGLAPSSGSVLGREPVPPAPQRENTIQVDGGSVTVEPASEGRALLTVHELRHCNAVVRLTRPQLAAAIAQMIAIRDDLPEVAPDVVGDDEDA